ncbi:MAG TPA: hypothetical protein VKC61_02040 [Pyrinomonadaceae bacterium]|nr:hypothetical protein [Pyrinomonadaceae bacterium]
METKIIVLGIILFSFAIFSAAPAVGRGSLQIQNATEKKAEEDRQQPAAEKVSETPEPKPQPTPETTAKKKLSFAYSGEITNYVVSESHAFFGESSRHWLETSLRLDGTVRYKHFTAGVSGLGVKTTGHDSYGTGTIPAGAPLGARPPSAYPSFYLDQAYVQLDRIGGLPLKATLGRQHITIGSQFLIGDGVYDGFSTKTQQGVFHSPRKGFDALRVEWDVKKTHFDSFIYRVDPTWDGGGRRDGLMGGLDVSRTFKQTKGTYAVGLFYRSSPSNLDNNMAVFDVRGEQPLRVIKGVTLSGEFAWEFAGRCRNAAYCTTIGQKMNEQSWHGEFGYEAKSRRFHPFAEAGYVFYSKDFTPIATGFSDWGKWYLGNQIDWIIFGTNTKIIRAQAGFWPASTIKLRALFHNTRQVENTGTSTGGSLANEVSFIGEWYPHDNLWFNVSLGHSRPGPALAASGLGNPFAFLNTGAAPLGTRDSLDVVFATSWRF